MVLAMGDRSDAHHCDLSRPVIVHASRLGWVESPSAGVERKMFYREGDEVARATDQPHGVAAHRIGRTLYETCGRRARRG